MFERKGNQYKKSSFDDKYIPVPESGCWLWVGPINKYGYGDDRFNEHRRAHRQSWIHHYGEIPEGMLVLHKCDVRSCINPDHLFLGTHKDNTQDMIKKGRKAYSAPPKKVTDEQVKEIRESNLKGVELQKIYKISSAQISRIITGKRRK